MGYKLADAVYRLKKGATTPSEQAVLLALAFRANDNRDVCRNLRVRRNDGSK